MSIKDRFYINLNVLREDYDRNAADDAEELKDLGSGKVSRKSDKKIQKMFRRDAADASKKAVTGMEPGRKGKKALGEEQLDEVSKELAKRAEDKAAKKFYDKYDSTTDLRKKAIKSKDKKDIEAAKKEEDKMHKVGKQAAKFQKYAAKKKMNEEEQLDELGDPTHMSYRAKARNQLDKMVNRLGSKMGSDTVNTKKMKNRAEGIKKSYKLQPKKK